MSKVKKQPVANQRSHIKISINFSNINILKGRRNTLAILITIISILLAVLGFFGFQYLKSTIWPITIEPQTISLNQGSWAVKNIFTVSNLRSDKTLYDVWIMLKFDDCSINPKSISLDLPDLDDTISGIVGNININYDCVIFKGLDSQKNVVIFLIIHHLVPSKSLQIVTNVDTNEDNIIGKDARIVIKSIHHSDTPVNLLKNGNELAYPFTPPFSFTLHSISLKMKRQ